MPDAINHPIVLRELEVIEVADVTPGMRRVVLGGEQLAAFSDGTWELTEFRTAGFDDHVKVFFPHPETGDLVLPTQDDGHLDWPDDVRPTSRDYTVRAFDAAAGRLTLDFVRHQGGVAAEWAVDVQPGERIHVAGPRASHPLPNGDWYLLVGDETALPAIGRWLEEADPATVGRVVVEVPTADDRQELPAPPGVEVTWLVRARRGDDTTLAKAVAALDFPAGEPVAWVAAEFSRVGYVRRHLIEGRGLSRDAVDTTSYWRRGVGQDETEGAAEQLRRLGELATPYALRTLITLGIPPLLASGITDPAELAATSGTRQRALTSLLRVMVPHDVIVEDPVGSFRLGPIGEPLADEWVEENYSLWSAPTLLDRAWAGLSHSLRTGEAAFPQVFGLPFWDYLAANPSSGESFDRMLDGWAEVWAPGIARARDWSATPHVVDVGGGIGRLLSAVLAKHPEVRGTLLEHGETATRAAARFAEAGLGDRADVIQASCFDAWPADGDCYVLAQVLHDWPDAEAIAILRRGAEAIANGGRVVLVERIVTSPPSEDHVGMDLLMLALFGAAERTLAEFGDLAAAAGLEVVGSAPGSHGLGFVELALA